MILPLLVLLAQELLLYDRPREAMQRYLETAKGPVELIVIPKGEPRPNVYGHYALGYGGQAHTDLELPNPAFFAHVDWVVKRATAKHLEVKLIAPNDIGFVRYLEKRYERNPRVSVVIGLR